MKILIVDDDDFILNFLSKAVSSFGHSFEKASCGKEALRIFSNSKFELVFLDINLPDIDGVTLLSKFKQLDEEIIIVMITGINDIDYIRNVMRLGAFDYVLKPINLEDIEILLRRVQDKLLYIKLKKECQEILEKRIKESTEKLKKLFLDSIYALVKTLEAKDSYHKEHSLKVKNISVEIARNLNVSDEFITNISIAALLHDIGKIGIPDSILLKNETLSRKELSIIKKHPVIGKEITETFIENKDIIYGILHHHEHWDGSGYPDRLKGEKIPLFSRIILYADAIDAMSSRRPYRNKLSFKKLMQELKIYSGKQFDPELLPLVLKVVENIFYEKKDFNL